MKKTLLFLSIWMFAALSMQAQNTTETAAPKQSKKEISVQCKKNISYFKVHAQAKNYKDAYTFWKTVYKECPDATKDIYVMGPKILRWKISEAKTAQEKQQFIEELMQMYDTRIQYFGDDPKYGKDYVLASKIADYIQYEKEKANFDSVYLWLQPIVDEKKESTDYMALNYYLFASMNRMLKNESLKENYINDYLKVSGYFDENIKKAAGNEESIKLYTDLKSAADTQFASSGAASCEMLEKIYTNKIEEHKADKDYLQTVINLLRKVRCEESPLYFKASEYAYAITPTAEAALGLAKRALLNNNRTRAIELFEEATKLSETADQRGDIYYNMALLSYDAHQYAKARTYANKAMQEKPNFGSPMILIANAYAATAQSIFPDDPIKARCVYCLVVDKLHRAKAIDPSCAAEANKLIGRYQPHFPSKDDIFMHPDLNEGQSFTIGGWIGESTTVRSN